MRRLGPILIATVAILTAGADAQVHDPPLFAAFKAFCLLCAKVRRRISWLTPSQVS